jgi:Zn-dependent metalloprotease
MISSRSQHKVNYLIQLASKLAVCLLLTCSVRSVEAAGLPQTIKELSHTESSTSTVSPVLTPQIKTFASSKGDKQKKTSVKKVATPALLASSSLADKFQQKISGQSATTKKTHKSTTGEYFSESLHYLDVLKEKAKNPSGFRYIISPAGTPRMIKADDLSDTPSPVSVKGVGKPAATNSDSSARKFLRSNRMALRLADPDSELELYKTSTDVLGITRHRYQQRFNGIPVWGKELSVYANKAGAIHQFFGNYQPTSTIQDTTPSFSAADALLRAISDLDISTTNITKRAATLVIWHDEKMRKDYLVWHIEVSASAAEFWHYFVDAKDGTIRNHFPGIMDGSAVPASGVDVRGKNRSFTAWEQDGLYYMIDVTRPVYDGVINTIQNTGDITVTDLQSNTVSSSASSTSGWTPAAVSAISNVYSVLDYYYNTHNLTGFSSTQQNIQIKINGSKTDDGFPNNAFFNPQDYTINFGAGDGIQFFNLASGLDVVAHEFTHGVISSTANLTYQNQSGALNESFADFFGAMVDRDDWTMGEDVYLPNRGVMRDLSHPHNSDGKQPEKMSEYVNMPNTAAGDWGGVHTNSGIPNRAAWLVAEGLTEEGSGISIGKEKTEKIWFRALNTYLHPNDGFLEARIALIQSASDLYGDSIESAAVSAAWDNVEIFNSMTGIASSITPSNTEPLPGSDLLVSVNNGGIYLKTSLGEFGPLNHIPSRNTRPSVVVGDTDTFIFYVDDVDNNIRTINLTTLADTVFDDSYYYWSLAISQNGEKLAFTKQAPEPYIYLVDVKQRLETPYYLAFQTDGGTSVGSIQYADVMNFDFAGRKIVFDAKSVVANNLDLPVYSNWTIGIIDLDTGAITAPVPPQNEAVDIGNPVFATNNNYMIAFEYEDAATNSIVTYNLTANRKDAMGIVAARNSSDLSYFRQPFFNGDDSAIIVKYEPTTGTSSIKSIPLTKTGNTWTGDQTAIMGYSANTGDFPLLFRNAQRSLISRISASPPTLDFGTLLSGTTLKKSIIIQNTGNIDLTLKDIVVTGAGFTHNGILGLLPRSSSMTIEVTYLASGLPGSKSESLIIISDAEPPNNSLIIPLTATVVIDQPVIKLNVTPEIGAGFVISPAVTQSVNYNETTSFTVTPAIGYKITSVTGCGGTLNANTYTTGAITANCTIHVTVTPETINGGTTQPTISDALKVLNSVTGTIQLTTEEKLRYDVAPLGIDGKPSGNGLLDAGDVISIMRRSIGIGNWLW